MKQDNSISIIENVRKFVKEECQKSSSKYGSEPYQFHFVPMVGYAKKLAEELGGDMEIITIASWLHDIGSIIEGRKDHHISGARIAEEKLQSLNYPTEKIDKVKNCILNHRGSKHSKRLTMEEKIVAEADALSNFENVSGILKAAFVYEGLNQKEAGKALRKKLQNKYDQLHFEQSKQMIKPKYEAVKLLFE